MAMKKIGTFSVPGKPHGKERPRFNSKTKKAYPTQAQIEAEGDVRRAYLQAGYERLEFDALIRVDVVCCYELPADMSEAEKAALIGTPAYTGSPVEKRRKKWERDNLEPDDKRYGPIPDGDNVLKTIQDGLQGQPKKRAYVAIMDDRQVVEASVRSVYGRESCTQVRITVLGPKDMTGGDAE